MRDTPKYTRDVHDTAGRRGHWTEAELAILEANPHLTTRDLAARLPGRSPQAIGNKRKWFSDDPVKCQEPVDEKPAVKEPGEYLETLNAYFMKHPECVAIWMKWNGYITYRELCRDMKASPLGVVTLLCQAKG